MTAFPFDPAIRRAILQSVDLLQDDAITLLSSLVRHRSLLGQEQSCLAAMEDIYRSLGLEPRRIPVSPAALQDHPGFSPPLIDYTGRDPVVALHHPQGRQGAAACCCKAMSMWCRKARPTSGPPRPSNLPSATTACMAAAPPT